MRGRPTKYYRNVLQNIENQENINAEILQNIDGEDQEKDNDAEILQNFSTDEQEQF